LLAKKEKKIKVETSQQFLTSWLILKTFNPAFKLW